MNDHPVLISQDSRGVATLTLNRPHLNNAYNNEMLYSLLEGVERLAADDQVRIIVIRGNGKFFQAGADLKWMNKLSQESADANLEMSKITTDAIRLLNICKKPTMALVHGGCFGGGLGIMAACDIKIASEETVFSITEVQWGLVASPILPQLCDAMGLSALRRYALTAERFSSDVAMRHGLIHEICKTGELDVAAAPVIDNVLRCSPSAITETKDFILETSGHLVDDRLAATITERHAARRKSRDGIEGLASFNEKRTANWAH